MADTRIPAGEATAAWQWEVSRDTGEVHALLCACDAHQAAASGTSAPARRLETTEHRVRSGSVHLLRHDGRPAGMFTLTWDPPFAADEGAFPPAERPLYLSRLAVAPEWLTGGSLVGLRCLRRAIETAAQAGGDALRSEANPDLSATRSLLDILGFVQHGPTLSDGQGRRRVHLHKSLRPASPGPGGED
uniref:2-sulfamoylacetyl transferase n=3 Tax=Streptomyces sp. TaxID=1931 RepID=SBZI_STRSQ|nr:GNAT family transferase [Streptomyces sp.]